ncbi:hypothetical protein ElyMa_001874100 [Elysia marginata]|uniref:Myb/SANT-like DNA-binding domain-containing protein n=1 Tax=Elysia marginata TaxID=1093978 RepID=A0AAV4EQ02_9GAST|nr:hypothetical protein ElyMa_001874100 [Elysia marginata]
MATKVKRARKANFSDRECVKLLDIVDANIGKLTNNNNTLRANAGKKAVWKMAAQELSAMSLVQRDEEDCRKKWRVSSLIGPTVTL